MGQTGMNRALRALACAGGLWAVSPAWGETASDQLPDLNRLSIDELANLEISSVSKKAEPISAAPAAVYALTPEEIRRSDANSIPEALRLAPNLTVRRVDALGYGISARGFGTLESSNKILAMIDGRSIYSSLHSGVFWDNNDLLLDDIARIEVVSGPGGTLWGANAVNGVINIITKSSKDTQGAFAKVGVGDQDWSVAGRFGGRVNENLTYRLYAKGLGRGATVFADGTSVRDDFNNIQGGFRADWDGAADLVTVQGDLHDGSSRDIAGVELRGGNLLGRWTHEAGDGTTRVQAYYDYTYRASPGVKETTGMYDLDVQHNRTLGHHDVVVGAGVRRNTDTFMNTLNIFVFAQPKRSLNLVNLFAQDSITLSDSLRLIGGVKAEHNDLTGWEIMPNGRIAWQPSKTTLVWASISRSVRTPSRIDRELEARPLLIPAAEFQSEDLLSYEAGFRVQPSDKFSLSISTYYNVYRGLRCTCYAPVTVFPIQFDNAWNGHVYGAEIWGSYALTPWWRMQAGLNLMARKFRLRPGQGFGNADQSLGNEPDYDASLKSTFVVTSNIDLDVTLRFADELPAPLVPSYTEADVRVAWRPSDSLEVSVAGHNLLHAHHPETGPVAGRREIPRSIYGTARILF
jgi:iron complex outermembrane receptor protein